MAAGYYLCAFVGTVLSLPPSGFAILWPATAFLVAALIVLPARDAWLVPAAVIPAHMVLVWGGPAGPAPLAVALTQVGGNLALAAASALAMRRASERPLRLDSFRGVLTFILVAGIAVPAAVNALILAVHMATGWARDFWLSWRQWMLASIFPTVTLAPLIVLAAQGQLLPRDERRLRLEAAILCPVLFALSFAVSGGHVDAEYWPAMLLAPMPLLLWAAVRWGCGGASLALIVFAGAIIARALTGDGPFAGHSPTALVLSLQVYLIAISVPLILLAALMEESRRAGEQLRRSEARIEIAAAATDTGLWQWEAAGDTLWMTEHCRAMFGLPPGTDLTPDLFQAMLHPADRARVMAAVEALATADIDSLGEFRIVRGGEARWFALRTHTERDVHGQPIRISGVYRDITRWIDTRQQAEELARRLLTLQADERRSIAAELHDSTGQHLTAARLTLRMLGRRLRLTEATRGLFDDVQGSIAAAATELRTFTYLLRPPTLERQGLNAVLRQYVGGFARRTGVQATLRLSPHADRLPAEQQHTVLRVTQECLTNIYRHAAARRVSVRLRFDAGRLHLLIRDDGRGMSPVTGRDGRAERAGVGLPGMGARIRQLGGRMTIRSGPGGTAVHAVLPVGDSVANPGDPSAGRRAAAGGRVFAATPGG